MLTLRIWSNHIEKASVLPIETLFAGSIQINEGVRNTIEHLRQSVVPVYRFGDRNACIGFITDVRESEAVYLVVHGPFEEQFLPLLDSISQIKAVYIFCHNSLRYHEEWRKNDGALWQRYLGRKYSDQLYWR